MMHLRCTVRGQKRHDVEAAEAAATSTAAASADAASDASVAAAAGVAAQVGVAAAAAAAAAVGAAAAAAATAAAAVAANDWGVLVVRINVVSVAVENVEAVFVQLGNV